MTKILQLIKPFFSMMSTGLLLVIYGISIGYATFVENDYGTTAARILIYNAAWFEVLLVLMAINLVGSIIRHKLIPQKKWSILLFHVAFLVILAGASITRYTGFEGTLHIREGEQNNKLLTESAYINISAKAGDESVNISDAVSFSPYTGSDVSYTLEIAGQKVKVENLQYVPSATETVVEDPAGEPVISLMAANMNSERIDFNLKQGDSKLFEGISFSFGPAMDSSTVSITLQGDSLFLSYTDSVFRIVMGDEQYGAYSPGTVNPFEEKVIYQAGTVGFVLKKYVPKGKSQLIYVPSHSETMKQDALDMKVSSGEVSKELFVYGRNGEPGKEVFTEINGITVGVSYGSVYHELPFSLKLNDFQLERYPGSKSPSSFASEVTLIDPVNSIEKPYRIFMNNILKHEGYRFFQSSYDQDEMGTVLSVNYDSTGTMVTYIGYFLMTLGMVLALFSRRSRFLRLARASARLGAERKKMFSALLFLGLLLPGISVFGQSRGTTVSPQHARDFGSLLVQNNEGRIEPVNTLASEILRKVAKKGTWNGMEPVQVLIEIMSEPEKWKNEEMIKVGDPELRRILGARDKYVAFNHVFEDGNTDEYKLQQLVEEAYAKQPAERNKFDKEVINVDERVNILYKVISGGYLTIYPISGDASNKWASITEALHSEDQEFSDYAKVTYSNYFAAVQQAKASGNYTEADKLLNEIKENQKQKGAAIYPPALKTKLEILYINHNIFSKLSKFYVFVGLILLIVQFVSLLSTKKWTKKAEKTGLWVVAALFLIHTAGLAIRWYISEHAPWSNGYETLLYISWATCLAGLTFSRRSPMTLAVTTILSAISLFVAGMSWMSPELTNLVPVLKSYWLVIHVAVITASYGFFAMAALLGLVNLILIILLPSMNSERIRFTIKELVLIIQMAIIVGLYMITIGSFLGGVWANESWGRYWGWDPKETWAMVTIVVYAFITHMHKIPGFRGSYAMSLAAVIGLGSVLMTFFGVNYYLSGLHSYAQGEPAPVPSGVYVAVFLVFVIGLTAFLAERRLAKAGVGNDAEEEI